MMGIALLEEELDDGQVALCGRVVQRRLSARVPAVHVCTEITFQKRKEER
jgi:hypothetical protein